MLALNSRQLSPLLFAVCRGHICSCHRLRVQQWRATVMLLEVGEVGGRGRAVGGTVVGGATVGAWRIIMTRLTLARAVGRGSRVTSPRSAPPARQIKLPDTRCTALKTVVKHTRAPLKKAGSAVTRARHTATDKQVCLIRNVVTGSCRIATEERLSRHF